MMLKEYIARRSSKYNGKQKRAFLKKKRRLGLAAEYATENKLPERYIEQQKNGGLTAMQQLEQQIKEKGNNPLLKIVGKWPGDETEEELLEMLNELD